MTIAVSGDYGKPRPALVVQSDAFDEIPSITVLLLTSELHDWPMFRIRVHPNRENGLLQPSDVMVDKAMTLPRHKIGERIGHMDNRTMQSINTALAAFLDLRL